MVDWAYTELVTNELLLPKSLNDTANMKWVKCFTLEGLNVKISVENFFLDPNISSLIKRCAMCPRVTKYQHIFSTLAQKKSVISATLVKGHPVNN
jgi:hypothetical protein